MKWIDSGLHFSCHQCGNCCTGSPGYVWVNVDEMKAIADSLNSSFDDFTKKYVRKVQNDYSLIEKANGDCILWDKAKGCMVYENRPVQCKTYPFWPEVIGDKKKWKREALDCLGVKNSLDKGEGQFYNKVEIEQALEISIKHDPTQ